MADHWNFGTPKKGTALVQRHKITVRRGGRDWNGHWEIDGDRLLVSSAYGSRSELAGKEDTLAARAEAMLGDILNDHGSR